MYSRLRRWLLVIFPKKYHALPGDDYIDWKAFEEKTGCRVKNREIFQEALRHRSHPSCSSPESKLSNERLEFLGDAVANFCVGNFVFHEYPRAPEGDLTKMRSVLVSREYMAKKSRALGIGQFLLLGEGEERSGGRNKDSILSNALEALIGAICLDRGLDAVREFLNNTILSDYRAVLESEGNNYKGDLLEHLQKNHMPAPMYFTKRESGPDHKRIYTVAVKVGEKVLGTGKGKSKKIAEQDAARHALHKINSRS